MSTIIQCKSAPFELFKVGINEAAMVQETHSTPRPAFPENNSYMIILQRACMAIFDAATDRSATLFKEEKHACREKKRTSFVEKLTQKVKRDEKETWVFSPKNFSFCQKNCGPQIKKRRKTPRYTMYTTMCSIPPWEPSLGDTHRGAVIFPVGHRYGVAVCLRTDKCSCDGCYAGCSTRIFVVFVLVFCPTKSFRKN